MRISSSTSLLWLFLSSLMASDAFTNHMRPTTSGTIVSLSATKAEDDDDKSASSNGRKVATAISSFVAASTLAVASLTVLPPIMEMPSFVQEPTNHNKIMILTGIPSANAAETKKAVSSTTPVKLSKEEKERIGAKKNYELSQQTYKEYQKYVSELTSAFKKTQSLQQAAIKDVTSAKQQYLKESDKLSRAKNERMPTSAIQELQAQTAKLKEVLKEKEAMESDLTKKTNKLEKDLKSGEQGLKDSESAIKKAKKRLEKAEKSYQQYAKKVQKEKKEAEKKEAERKKKEQKVLREQEEKVKRLAKDSEKLKSLKEKEAKELQATQKALESELKNLEKLKAKTK